MAKSVAARNAAVDGQAAITDLVSVHSADPGTTGANLVGAKTAATFGAASAGAATSGPVTVAIPAAGTTTTITHWGTWDATTFLEGGLLVDDDGDPTPETYSTSGGEYDLQVTLTHP